MPKNDLSNLLNQYLPKKTIRKINSNIILTINHIDYHCLSFKYPKLTCYKEYSGETLELNITKLNVYNNDILFTINFNYLELNDSHENYLPF